MKIYITFGQVHVHSVGGKTLDKDCVAVLESPSYSEGRQKAMDAFERRFHNAYAEDEWDESLLEYFPRGYIEIQL